ncbi:carboxyl transferase domain-containing protein [Streptomyces sp. NPDC056656]|uniref:carboxyl transferase domain-containing protein n=1 Tax=Streptomyces sp. NPDC056656 TaxID=3345895 RepID=UPI0036B999C8
MKVLVLGSLGVEAADGTVTYVQGFQATLITELLAADSMVVSTDRLAEALYGEDTPRSPLRAVHAHITRLRRALRQWEPEGPGAERLLTKATGYALKVSSLESDAGQFLAELTRARTLALTEADAAVEILKPALSLWRGPVLEGTSTGMGGGHLATRLEAARREAAEQLASARMALGQCAQAATELEDLLLDIYDESLARLLATALSRSGRPHEARRVEQRIRRAFRVDLGVGAHRMPERRPGRVPDQPQARYLVERVPRQPRPARLGGRGQQDSSSPGLLKLMVDRESPARLGSTPPPRVPGTPAPAHRGPTASAGVYRVGGFPVAVVRDVNPERFPDGQGVLRTLEYARKACLPVVLLVGEPGRHPEAVSQAPTHQVTILRSLVQLRGVVPRVVISFDDGVASSPGIAALGDVCIVVRPDPPAGTGRYPMAEIEARSVVEAAASGRELLDYLTRHCAPAAPPWTEIEPFAPQGVPLGTRDVIAGIADSGGFLELTAEQGPTLLTGLARIEGKRVGIIANNPVVGDGVLTPQAASKGARMVDLCALWNIPLLVLVDTPQIPGTGVSGARSLPEAAGSELLRAFLGAQVPRVTVLVGRATGWSRLVMGARETGADAVYAWPRAQTDVADGGLDGIIAPQATRAVVSTLLGACRDHRLGA